MVACIGTGTPIAIILGIPALGLTASKDIALAQNPISKAAQQMPTSVGGTAGLVLDLVKEPVTGERSNDTFQAGGEFAESVYNLAQLKKQ